MSVANQTEKSAVMLPEIKKEVSFNTTAYSPTDSESSCFSDLTDFTPKTTVVIGKLPVMPSADALKQFFVAVGYKVDFVKTNIPFVKRASMSAVVNFCSEDEAESFMENHHKHLMVDSTNFNKQYTMGEVEFASMQGFEDNMDSFIQQTMSFQSSSESDLWVATGKANVVAKQQEEICIVCCENVANTTMYPVQKHKGHEHTMCAGCAAKVKKMGKGCPMCRQQFRLPEDFMNRKFEKPATTLRRNTMRRPSL